MFKKKGELRFFDSARGKALNGFSCTESQLLWSWKGKTGCQREKSDNLYNLRSTVQFNFKTLNKSILLQDHFMKRTWGLRSSCHFKGKVFRTSAIAMGVLVCLQIPGVWKHCKSMRQCIKEWTK